MIRVKCQFALKLGGGFREYPSVYILEHNWILIVSIETGKLLRFSNPRIHCHFTCYVSKTVSEINRHCDFLAAKWLDFPFVNRKTCNSIIPSVGGCVAIWALANKCLFARTLLRRITIQSIGLDGVWRFIASPAITALALVLWLCNL